MGYIKKIVDSIPDDKKDHIVVGCIYAVFISPSAIVGYFLADIIGMFFFASMCFVLGTYFNIYKEVYHDWYKEQGTPEWADFIATETPLLIGYLPYLLIFLTQILWT